MTPWCVCTTALLCWLVYVCVIHAIAFESLVYESENAVSKEATPRHPGSISIELESSSSTVNVCADLLHNIERAHSELQCCHKALATDLH